MRLLSVFAVGLAFLPVIAHGQDSPTLGGLARQTGWATFSVVQGRLAILDVPPRCERSTACADAEGQIRESLCVKAEGRDISLHYEFISPKQRLTVEAIGGRKLEIHRWPVEDNSPVELHLVQAPSRDLTLTIGAGAERREFSAPDFWRLMLAEPDVVRDCLTPLLESLRPNWDLHRQAAQIEQRLYELAVTARAPDTARWETLIEQLGDRSFVRREAADRALRAEGQAAAPFLDQIELQRLDAEQKARLQGILRSLSASGEDTPHRVASRLVNDQHTWLVLLAREDADKRSAAARQLCKLCPEAVSFDPQADQAVRRAQLRRLRQQLAHD